MSQPINKKEIGIESNSWNARRHQDQMVSQTTWSNTLDPLPGKHSLSSSTNHGRMAQFLLYWKKPPSSQSIKKIKGKKGPNSYHPVSLLSCLGKLLEWVIKLSEQVINRRLISFLEVEEQKILSPTQNGYWKHRRSAGPHYPEDRECLSWKEKDCFCLL